ncbi:MAG TPA: SpoIIE family protein phosphatase [Terracidiphilus sp.]|nr:SpoIIE family protein phosphatase [Terracidiphilus sp.]
MFYRLGNLNSMLLSMLRLPVRSLLVGLCLCASAALSSYAALPSPTTALSIDGLGKGTVKLDGPWQFHVGDNPAWSAASTHDATGINGWEQITADEGWGSQGHANYVGFAWYRKHIDITPAPGASPDIALYIPAIDDVYEIYWNGVRIGSLGSCPPNFQWYMLQFPQTYGLGPIRSGVLAIRVYKTSLASVDDGTAGGFEAAPTIGSPAAIAQMKDASDFHWMQHSQFQFGLTSLYVLAALLSFITWLRDRQQRLLMWFAIFCFIPLVELALNTLHFHIPATWLTFFIQTAIQLREVAQWYLLVYLLELDHSRGLMRFLHAAFWITLLAGALDGSTAFVITQLNQFQFGVLDGVLTAVILPAEAIPSALVVYALVKRKRLNSGSWLVAIFAFLTAAWYAVSNVAFQGIRYTHWTLSPKMGQPLFTLFGSIFPMLLVLRTLLFLSIVYAVIRYAADYRRRQGTLEQEYKSARELQQVLIPEDLPALPGYAFTSAYKPAQEVGGDFFQVIPLEGAQAGSTLILLGDVSGKGLKAAMTVSLIVGATRALARFLHSPAAILSELNGRLHGRMQGGFVTCLALRLDANGQCTVASAGHPAPYLNNRELPLPGALPLGVMATSSYDEQSLELREGDHFALYTDGLLEARSATGEIFSFERLDTLFATRPDAARAAEAAVDFGQDDDITVLTLTRLVRGERSTTQLIAPSLAGA